MKPLPNGILRENPIFHLSLGLCPSLAVSTTVSNALGMSAATIFVLIGSNTVVSLFRKKIHYDIHMPAYIVIIATFVTIVDMLMAAYLPPLSKSLGIYTPLIVVNCIILGRAEAFASKNSVRASIVDALSMGMGFTLGLTLIAFVREILGAGTLTLIPEKAVLRIPLIADAPAMIFIFPAGALIVMGFLQVFYRWINEKAKGDTSS